jgi:hypothetical protein
MSLCQESWGGWYLHDNAKATRIEDHEAYIKEFVAELEDNKLFAVR